MAYAKKIPYYGELKKFPVVTFYFRYYEVYFM